MPGLRLFSSVRRKRAHDAVRRSNNKKRKEKRKRRQNKMKNELENKKPAPTLAEIAAQIEENAGKIEELKDKRGKTRGEWDNLREDEKVSRFDLTPEGLRIMRERVEIEKEIEKSEKISAILRHNYRAVLAPQVLPVFVEILKKYGGRKAGEKTRKKINEEMRSSCGCCVWFDRCLHNNCFSAEIYESTDEGYRRGESFTIYGSLIDEGNVINGKLTVDDLRADVGEYIENPAARVEAIAEADRRVEEARKTYNETVDAYNALIVDGCKEKTRAY
jgi:hypothetical protein